MPAIIPPRLTGFYLLDVSGTPAEHLSQTTGWRRIRAEVDNDLNMEDDGGGDHMGLPGWFSSKPVYIG